MARREGKPAGESAVLAVRIQPRASKNEVVGTPEGGLRIRLTAPPVDNAANEALIGFLADKLSVSRSRVAIASGRTSREKRVRIEGMSGEEAMRLLNIRRK